jgi:hypothetical protein
MEDFWENYVFYYSFGRPYKINVWLIGPFILLLR